MRRNGILPAIILLTGLLLWTGCTPPVLRTPTPVSPFDEAAFWEGFPLPDDARVVPAAEGQELAFATGMIEPELFDFYAQWLREKGWSQQAPTEAMITLPHQRWRRDSLELLIELQLSDEDGRTIVRCQVQSDTK
ncbi:MAG TPA: hypothetical protein VM537_28795 [Anaerolineae bacterium]|nr:hypothetical protein [Anaerolineae bacterium]